MIQGFLFLSFFLSDLNQNNDMPTKTIVSWFIFIRFRFSLPWSIYCSVRGIVVGGAVVGTKQNNQNQRYT